MKLEELKIEKLDQYIAIYQEIFSDDNWDNQSSSEEIFLYIKRYFLMNNFKGYEFILEEKLIGFCFGFLKPWLDGYEFYIERFCIRKKYQGLGYGSNFLKLIEIKLKNLGEVSGILLETEVDIGAYEFYLKNNFYVLRGLKTLIKDVY